MFLKQITLAGFKSFADRTEFEFGAGLTVVVGPNGCGKSNILDAVRWVLGEQSARSLRGERMADVIFAGSLSRKPANFAEVQLIFDNSAGILRSDEAEVTVTRTLYRSGESEYRLNGNVCRLKDIRELLLDTGVGVDAYSVIEQGRVDQLLRSSPAERREIFEEAAGISRYKVRRIEAQRKLERTQENLLRLQDILAELERRLRSVRLAAGKARNFQEYDARLRELRSRFHMAEYHELEQGRQRVAGEVDELTAALAAERTRQAECDAGAAELARSLQTLDEQIQTADAELHALENELSALAERGVQGERRLAETVATRARRERQDGELAAQRADLEARLAVESAGLDALRQAEARAAAAAAEAQARRDESAARAADMRQGLEGARAAAFDAVRGAALVQNERTNLAQHQARLSAQAGRLEDRLGEVRQELERLAAHAAELVAQADALDQQAAVLAETMRRDEALLAALGEEATRLDAAIGTDKETRSALLSRLELLEDMERRLEGVDAGTRAVLAWADQEGRDQGIEGSRDQGAEQSPSRDQSPCGSEGPDASQPVASARDLIVGLVADLLRIDDPRVGLLQSVLAAFEDHLVVRSLPALLDELARRAAPGGPLRVLALDRLSPRTLADGYETTPGFVARASDWVSCAPEHRPLAEQLLGRAIVVDTLERALRLAGEALAGYAFITPDGWTVRADGRLSHGAGRAAAGLISRKTEIRQLRGEVAEVEARLVQQTRRRLEVEAATSDAQLRRQGALEQIATLQRRHAELRGDRGRAEEAHQRLEREAALVAGELAVQRRALLELGEQGARLDAESQALAAAQQARETDVERLARELEELDANLGQFARAHTEALVEKGRAAEKRAAGEEVLSELQARTEGLAAAQAAARQEAEQAAAQIAAAEAELADSRARHAAGAAAAEARRAAVLKLREDRQGLRQRLEESGTAARELQRRIEAAEAHLHAQQVELRELEVRREALAARVRDELGLDLAERYAGYEHSDQDWPAVRTEIEELKGKIARLGNVNLDALAELEELTPRYEHLAAQRDDLVSAGERLTALITELDAESRARFARTFEEVRGHFQELFRKLFGGGKADVILEDAERPLECGIEIIARPPGKEPQVLSLLSGGEKTMTAVALLMAVFCSRPSPFAILDEVDAALDEANTDRFNKLLAEFLAHSQFVVITHSKRTMASADVLYGITMEEPGVSKRVSVRFDQRVRTPEVA